MDKLTRLATNVAPQLSLIEHAPAAPDEMVELCRAYDIGLGIEETQVPNRSLCLTNKALTYILAGLAVVLTDTIGQRPLADSLKEGALVYPPGDVEALARGLSAWAHDPWLLRQAKAAAWRAAQTRWHWDHEEEKGKLIHVIQSVVQ
jgi:glycosyltransferase involved in cell wall biosynthesis